MNDGIELDGQWEGDISQHDFSLKLTPEPFCEVMEFQNFHQAIPTTRGSPANVYQLRDKTNINRSLEYNAVHMVPKKYASWDSSLESSEAIMKHSHNDQKSPIFNQIRSVGSKDQLHYEVAKKLESIHLTRTISDDLPTERTSIRPDNFRKPVDDLKKTRANSTPICPLLHVRSPPKSIEGSPTPNLSSESTCSSDAVSYTAIFRDPPHLQVDQTPRELFSSWKSYDSFHNTDSEANFLYTANIEHQYNLQCDKCGQTVPNGNFRQHNQACSGKKCNRCFQTVIGSYEAHKQKCFVRRCDRCGIIPHESFKEHNRICKQISSCLWKRWQFQGGVIAPKKTEIHH